ncbi:MAG: ATP-dependent RecD-like DNA helicase [Synergistaceae bacterium]|nr:ATP-dependent RecD-like DNA helicase [Synergistaceae bacterium]
MEKLQCVVERITFRNETNGYSVIKCEAESYSDLIAAVGVMPDVHVGGVYNLSGYWKVDPRYGRQFYFQTCEETLPATTHGIEKYLGSGLIKGIGPVYAAKIVKVFGKKTIDILDNDPDKLGEVPGIGEKRIKTIKSSWQAQRAIRDIMIFLQGYDVTTSLAAKIFKTYEDKSIEKVTENPYRLADDIWGVGFKTADSIAKKLGFGHERYERLRSGMLYALKKLSEVGHCFAYKDELFEAASELLEVDKSLLDKPLKKMIKQNDVVADEGEAIYLPTYYYSECGTAERLLSLVHSGRNFVMDFDELTYGEWAHTDGKNIHYDDVQLEAIKAAIDNKVLVLTGGPGTGKTTTTLGIINAYRCVGAKILLAAPTGRAAKRMSEVTNMEAKTIHRLLEMKPSEGFQRDEDRPLEGDVLIVDECSMIDIVLMYSLLKAVPSSMTLILVGDVDQLPSVGAGKVLADILNSGAVPFVKLNKIFRQAQYSKIVTNAHRINHGDYLYLTDDPRSDFVFIEAEEPEQAEDWIVKFCAKNAPRVSLADIQVLTPMRKSVIGTMNLNQRLQEVLNPSKLSLKRGGVEYRVRDKVMQIRNNYEKLVFNGDIGFITSIDEDDNTLTVRFDDRDVAYDINELDELVLSYASTIHKSQGSEFPIVVMPIMMTHYIMLQRNLLYTGVTRAKKKLFVVGQKKAIYMAIKNNEIVERNTRLAERLREG